MRWRTPVRIIDLSLIPSSIKALRGWTDGILVGLHLLMKIPAPGDDRSFIPTLEMTLAALDRRYGQGIVHTGAGPNQGVRKTGIESLDALFPSGGMPRGRLSWIRGEPGMGSYDLSLALLAGMSRTLPVAVVDFDQRVDPGDVADYGGDMDNCWVVRPKTPEQGWAAARSLVRAGVEFCLLVAAAWRPLGRAIPAVLLAALEERGGVAVMAGGMAVPLEVGGRLGLELSCRREGWSMAHGDVAGILIQLTVSRSRLGPSGAGCRLRIDFPRPYLRGAGIADLGMLEPWEVRAADSGSRFRAVVGE